VPCSPYPTTRQPRTTARPPSKPIDWSADR